MLRGVDPPSNTQNFLSGGDRYVVSPGGTEDIEPGPEARAGKQSQPGAPGTAMQVQTEVGRKAADRASRGRQHLCNIRVSFENRGEAVFGYDGNFQIGTRLFEQTDSRSRQNTVTQRTKANQ